MHVKRRIGLFILTLKIYNLQIVYPGYENSTTNATIIKARPSAIILYLLCVTQFPPFYPNYVTTVSSYGKLPIHEYVRRFVLLLFKVNHSRILLPRPFSTELHTVKLRAEARVTIQEIRNFAF